MVKNKNSENYNVFLLVLVLAVLACFGYMYFEFVQPYPTGLITYNESNQTEINYPPIWSYNETVFTINKNQELILDLNNYFSDPDQEVLSYLVTQPSGFSVLLEGSILSINPDQNFVGDRMFAITASDETSIVTKNIKVIVQETEVTFDEGETIQDKDDKFVGKKVVDEIEFETYFNYIIKNNSGLFLSFYHDSEQIQNIWIEGNVSYELSKENASARENITLVVYREQGIIPKFKLHIGTTSEVFEFGKEIPEVIVEDKDGNPADFSFIDRDDEKLDVEVTKEDAKAVIKGITVSQIEAKIDIIDDEEILTKVFAAESIDMEEATITLPKHTETQGVSGAQKSNTFLAIEDVNIIMECSDFNLTEFECKGTWVETDLVFEENNTHITFTVDHFSGYGGGNIDVLTVNSFPMVGTIWTVEFNTTGTENLTITPINGTQFGIDLIFLSLSCGDTIINAQYDGTKVFYENFNCSNVSYEKSTVLTRGKHYLKFEFGNDTAYAYNTAYSGLYNLSTANFTLYGEGSGDLAGKSVATGDITGDGVLDLVIGAPGYDDPASGDADVGKVYGIFGPLPTNGSVINLSNANVSWFGANASDQLGYSVAVGDLNNDSIDDIIMGAPYFDPKADLADNEYGAVYIVYGHAGLTGTLNLSLSANFNASFTGEINDAHAGWSLAVGDVGFSNTTDLIIGSPDWQTGGGLAVGKAYVLFGTNTAFSGTASLSTANASFEGEGAVDAFGHAVAVGNVNNDGTGDILIGAPRANAGGHADSGKFYIINGSINNGMSGNVSLHCNGSYYGEGATSNLGWSINAGGDVNNDSITDFMVGAYLDDIANPNTGKAYLFYGRSQYHKNGAVASYANASWYGEAVNDELGYSVLITSMLNDSYADVMISSYNQSSVGGSLAGRFYLIYGQNVSNTIAQDISSAADASWYSQGSGTATSMASGSLFVGTESESLDASEIGAVYSILTLNPDITITPPPTTTTTWTGGGGGGFPSPSDLPTCEDIVGIVVEKEVPDYETGKVELTIGITMKKPMSVMLSTSEGHAVKIEGDDFSLDANGNVHAMVTVFVSPDKIITYSVTTGAGIGCSVGNEYLYESLCGQTVNRPPPNPTDTVHQNFFQESTDVVVFNEDSFNGDITIEYFATRISDPGTMEITAEYCLNEEDPDYSPFVPTSITFDAGSAIHSGDVFMTDNSLQTLRDICNCNGDVDITGGAIVSTGTQSSCDSTNKDLSDRKRILLTPEYFKALSAFKQKANEKQLNQNSLSKITGLTTNKITGQAYAPIPPGHKCEGTVCPADQVVANLDTCACAIVCDTREHCDAPKIWNWGTCSCVTPIPPQDYPIPLPWTSLGGGTGMWIIHGSVTVNNANLQAPANIYVPGTPPPPVPIPVPSAPPVGSSPTGAFINLITGSSIYNWIFSKSTITGTSIVDITGMAASGGQGTQHSITTTSSQPLSTTKKACGNCPDDTAVPTPTPTAVPTPSGRPGPTPTPAPRPGITYPAPTGPPVPTPTPLPTPTPTPAPRPGITYPAPTGPPVPTPTPLPTPTPTPTPSPTPRPIPTPPPPGWTPEPDKIYSPTPTPTPVTCAARKKAGEKVCVEPEDCKLTNEQVKNMPAGAVGYDCAGKDGTPPCQCIYKWTFPSGIVKPSGPTWSPGSPPPPRTTPPPPGVLTPPPKPPLPHPGPSPKPTRHIDGQCGFNGNGIACSSPLIFLNPKDPNSPKVPKRCPYTTKCKPEEWCDPKSCECFRAATTPERKEGGIVRFVPNSGTSVVPTAGNFDQCSLSSDSETPTSKCKNKDRCVAPKGFVARCVREKMPGSEIKRCVCKVIKITSTGKEEEIGYGNAVPPETLVYYQVGEQPPEAPQIVAVPEPVPGEPKDGVPDVIVYVPGTPGFAIPAADVDAIKQEEMFEQYNFIVNGWEVQVGGEEYPRPLGNVMGVDIVDICKEYICGYSSGGPNDGIGPTIDGETSPSESEPSPVGEIVEDEQGESEESPEQPPVDFETTDADGEMPGGPGAVPLEGGAGATGGIGETGAVVADIKSDKSFWKWLRGLFS